MLYGSRSKAGKTKFKAIYLEFIKPRDYYDDPQVQSSVDMFIPYRIRIRSKKKLYFIPLVSFSTS